ncbi:hypothetical protein Esti_003118 [Eimeria stiedai]
MRAYPISSMLDPKKSDYLIRVIDLAAEAEKKIPPPSLCEDSRRPKSLSCAAFQAISIWLGNRERMKRRSHLATHLGAPIRLQS